MNETEMIMEQSHVTDAVVNGYDAVVNTTNSWMASLPADDLLVTLASWF